MEGAPGREYLSTFARPSLNRPWKRTAVQAVNITAIHRLYWQAFAVIALGSARIYTATAERLIYQAVRKRLFPYSFIVFGNRSKLEWLLLKLA